MHDEDIENEQDLAQLESWLNNVREARENCGIKYSEAVDVKFYTQLFQFTHHRISSADSKDLAEKCARWLTRVHDRSARITFKEALTKAINHPTLERSQVDDAEDSSWWRHPLQYRVMRELGVGAKHTVFEALDVTTGQLSALKVLSDPVEDLYLGRHESMVCQHLGSHENLVPYFDSWEMPWQLYTRESQVPQVRVTHVQRMEPALPCVKIDVAYKEWQLRIFFRDLVAGLSYMHSRGVVHRDLNPAQLLFNRQGRVLIGDLDNARFVPGSNGELPANMRNPPIGVCGTTGYLSPEILFERFACLVTLDGHCFSFNCHKAAHYIASDVYSLGLILCEWLYGENVFHMNQEESETFRQTVARDWAGFWQCLGDTYGSQVASPSASFRHLIEQLLEPDYTRRMTLAQVKRHPWFLQPADIKQGESEPDFLHSLSELIVAKMRDRSSQEAIVSRFYAKFEPASVKRAEASRDSRDGASDATNAAGAGEGQQNDGKDGKAAEPPSALADPAQLRAKEQLILARFEAIIQRLRDIRAEGGDDATKSGSPTKVKVTSSSVGTPARPGAKELDPASADTGSASDF